MPKPKRCHLLLYSTVFMRVATLRVAWRKARGCSTPFSSLLILQTKSFMVKRFGTSPSSSCSLCLCASVRCTSLSLARSLHSLKAQRSPRRSSSYFYCFFTPLPVLLCVLSVFARGDLTVGSSFSDCSSYNGGMPRSDTIGTRTLRHSGRN